MEAAIPPVNAASVSMLHIYVSGGSHDMRHLPVRLGACAADDKDVVRPANIILMPLIRGPNPNRR